MSRSQTSFQKRQRELQRQRKREEKAERRRQRREEQTAERDAVAATGVDPDLEGIVAGPHNNQSLLEDVEVEMDGVGGVLVKRKTKGVVASKN